MRLIQLLNYAFLLTILSSCFSVLANVERLSQKEREALKLFIHSNEPTRKPQIIDLTVPENMEGYMALLHYHGITKNNKPDFFYDIEKTRGDQRELIATGKGLVLINDESTPQNYFSVPVIYSEGEGMNVRAEVTNSIYAPNATEPDYILNTLTVYTLPDGEIIAAGSEDSNSADVRLQFTTADTGTDPKLNNPKLDPVSAMSIIYVKVNGVTEGPYKTVSEPIAAIPLGLKNTAPERKKGQNERKHILICLNRSNPDKDNVEECDYGPMTPGLDNKYTHINMELIGEVEFRNKIVRTDAGDISGSFNLTLVGMDTGGGCSTRVMDSGVLNKHFTVDSSGKKLTWNFSSTTGYADFGALCWKNNQNYILDFVGMVNTNATGTDKGLKIPVNFHYTNANNAGGEDKNDSTYIYPAIKMQYGCIASGTLIEMAEGVSRKIEDIRPGNHLLSRNGRVLKVKSRVVGVDTSFVNVTYNNDKFVSLTPGHPVSTPRGIVRADELKDGDKVITKDKSYVIDSINFDSKKTKEVYNLVLENIDNDNDNDNEMEPEEALFYAGGILVGDNRLQEKISKKR
ncbi:Hint domain-containing protein [Serratia bockelmannii]|uniref:Hint domain-containing protein n=1 Tax=Serratia bockelmannii TaxID=2703793 RepID=UPI003FA7E4EF